MSIYIWISIILWILFILGGHALRDPPDKYDYPSIPIEKMDIYTTPVDVRKEWARQEEAKKLKKPEYTFNPESQDHFAAF
tara:strand:+ start:26 stop:265 length:240 start_codon:yes stop_codon:yes gene_type:complete